MPEVMEGLRVIDLSSSMAGALTTMLLADYGAEVVKVEAPGGDPLRRLPASIVWFRGKRSVVLEVSDDGHTTLAALVGRADVVVDDGVTTPMLAGLGGELPGEHDRLVRCSVTAFGSRGRLAGRPVIDGLVQAQSAVQFEQPPNRGGRSGPIFYASPLPSYGAAVLANIGIAGALWERELSGLGQRVETSLLQGALAWTVIPWSRVEKPTPSYFTYRPDARDIMPTPMHEAGDHLWMHPMPECVGAVLEELGRGPRDLPRQRGGADAIRAYQRTVQELYLQRPRQRWLDLLWEKDLRVQPILSVEEAFGHPQLAANQAVHEVDVDGVGAVKQFAHPYWIRGFERKLRGGPPAPGADTAAVLDEIDGTAPQAPRAEREARVGGPLAGIRVLDFGLALAGPYGPMQLADLGADVIRIENARGRRPAGAKAGSDTQSAPDPATAAIAAVTSSGNQTWVACQRGKRSISIDLKNPEGLEIARRLIAGADVIHHNMRPGAADRLGIGFEDAKQLNPKIVYCNVTGFGPEGPLADAPGCDQLAQALTGLEHEQGAVAAGGTPTWHRIGFTDHVAALCSVIGVIQALYLRERTGEAAMVESNILSAAAFALTHMFSAPEGSGMEPWHLDRAQTGLGPLYRLYETSDGWLMIACLTEAHWASFTKALGRTDLAEAFPFDDTTPFGRPALAGELEPVFRGRTATDWLAALDGERVPCAIADEDFLTEWFDLPQTRENGMVADYEHAFLGRVQHLGSLVNFSATPESITQPPVIPGQHTVEILTDLGYSSGDVERLRAQGVVVAYEVVPPSGRPSS
jgi:crotonobetainyl-CoA:carnitine CoA-transferase CaiB-like acyl-CoA transferase